MKTCCRCNRSRYSKSFSIDRRSADGLKGYCKDCAAKENSLNRAKKRVPGSAEDLIARSSDPQRIKNIIQVVTDSAGKEPAWSIGERLGLSQQGVQYYAAAAGVSLAFQKLHWTEEHNRQLIDLRRWGMTEKAIGELTGRTAGAVHMQLMKLRKEGKL